jgi:prevent-host-death family protein
VAPVAAKKKRKTPTRVFGGGTLARENQIHNQIKRTRRVSYKDLREHMRTVLDIVNHDKTEVVVAYRGRPMGKLVPVD